MADSPLAKDDPRMVAWKAYQETDDYKNTRRWALREHHVDGSLWAAFEQGFRAAALTTPTVSDMRDAEGQEIVRQIMEQAQVFASSYSLVGGRFDLGDQMAHANEEKADLLRLVISALSRSPTPVPDAEGHKRGVEAAIEALRNADYGYSINLTRLVDGVYEYTLSYKDERPPIIFESYDDASDFVAEHRDKAKVEAAIAAYLATRSPSTSQTSEA